MEGHATIPHLRESVVFLAAAGVVVPALHHLRISPVLGFLAIGSLIGPFGLGLLADDLPPLSSLVISDLDGVRALAELGVIFLLFMIGLELSLDRLWAMRRLVFGLGSLQVLLTGWSVGLIAWGFGNTASASVVLGACLALSSTAIVTQLLMQSRRLITPVGRVSFSILLMQDLAVVPILLTVGMLAAEGGAGIASELATALFNAALAIGLIYAAGRLLMRPAYRWVARTRSPEALMAATLLTVIGISAVTAAAGLSMALGAFLAGLLLAETEYRHQIQVDIEPFKGLLLGLFFVSVGMGIDWREVGELPLWIGASVAGLLVVKATIVVVLCLAFRLPRHVAMESGLLLSQGGEFAFVVVALATSLALLPPDTAQFMLIVVALSMAVTPVLAGLARRASADMESRANAAAQLAGLSGVDELGDHVILAGFGRVGRTLASIFEAEAIPYMALEADPARVASARAERMPVFYGDASRLDLLEGLHIERAQAVVVTLNDFEAAERIVVQIRRHWPLLPIFCRARDSRHASWLIAAGANTAVPETVEGSLQLAGRVLIGLGATEEVVTRRIDQQRARDQEPTA